MKPQTYKPQRIHTYSDMMREAICYLRPDITPEMLAHETKASLREIYCYLKNTQAKLDDLRHENSKNV